MSLHNSFIALRVTPGAINGLMGSAIAWTAKNDASLLGLWTEGAYGVDLMFTGFLLPSISWFILRTVMRIRALMGKDLEASELPSPWLRHVMPTSFWGGGLFIGSVGTIVGCATVFVLQSLGSPTLDVSTYVALKFAYSALLAAMIQPTLVHAALQPLIVKKR